MELLDKWRFVKMKDYKNKRCSACGKYIYGIHNMLKHLRRCNKLQQIVEANKIRNINYQDSIETMANKLGIPLK